MTTGVTQVEPFEARRAIERLRSGVFDPIAVRHLTAGEQHLAGALDTALQGSGHLCVCGSFGEGKSHALRFLEERALGRGFATSLITLDPREIPFHRPKLVYRALMGGMRLPGEESDLIRRWGSFARGLADPEQVLPSSMPRPFRQLLGAAARPTVTLDRAQRAQRQHRRYNPSLIGRTLRRALEGDAVGAVRIRNALRYRQVPDRQGPLSWRGDATLLATLSGYAEVFQAMGMRGWVVLFDEGESMAQVRAPSRQKAWDLLDGCLTAARGLVPVFAFTDELLQRLDDDDRQPLRRRLALHTLGDLPRGDWASLISKLTVLHGRAYGWSPPARAATALAGRLDRAGERGTRLVLKALVDELDLQERAAERDG